MREVKFRTKLTPQEKDFWNKCYKIGMKNGWMNGKFAEADGDFIVEEDRLNKKSVAVIDDIGELRKYFAMGNWGLGSSVIYKNLCFMNQINGGDEWLVIKQFKNGIAKAFESYTLGPSARSYQGETDKSYLNSEEENLSKEELEKIFPKEINELMEAKLYSVKEKGKEGVLGRQ